MSTGIVLTGLNALSAADDTPKLTLLAILDGSMYDTLVAAKAKNYDQMTEIYKYLSDPDPARRAIAEKARASNLAARNALQDAINNYSKLVGWIQTVAGKQYSPKQLSGLGFVGVDDAALILTLLIGAGLAATATLYALSYAINTVTGKTQETKGYLDQLAGALGSLADVLKYGSIAAVIGVAIYFGSGYLKRRSA